MRTADFTAMRGLCLVLSAVVAKVRADRLVTHRAAPCSVGNKCPLNLVHEVAGAMAPPYFGHLFAVNVVAVYQAGDVVVKPVDQTGTGRVSLQLR